MYPQLSLDAHDGLQPLAIPRIDGQHVAPHPSATPRVLKLPAADLALVLGANATHLLDGVEQLGGLLGQQRHGLCGHALNLWHARALHHWHVRALHLWRAGAFHLWRTRALSLDRRHTSPCASGTWRAAQCERQEAAARALVLGGVAHLADTPSFVTY